MIVRDSRWSTRFHQNVSECENSANLNCLKGDKSRMTCAYLQRLRCLNSWTFHYSCIIKEQQTHLSCYYRFAAAYTLDNEKDEHWSNFITLSQSNLTGERSWLASGFSFASFSTVLLCGLLMQVQFLSDYLNNYQQTIFSYLLVKWDHQYQQLCLLLLFLPGRVTVS